MGLREMKEEIGYSKIMIGKGNGLIYRNSNKSSDLLISKAKGMGKFGHLYLTRKSKAKYSVTKKI